MHKKPPQHRFVFAQIKAKNEQQEWQTLAALKQSTR
jgi:hypothetical protein